MSYDYVDKNIVSREKKGFLRFRYIGREQEEAAREQDMSSLVTIQAEQDAIDAREREAIRYGRSLSSSAVRASKIPLYHCRHCSHDYPDDVAWAVLIPHDFLYERASAFHCHFLR
jgi:hypothetical protein